MARKLKVFRTPIGFHDAYVAAPSRKAALEAWGTARDLFARGAAEEIDDPELSNEPLAHPGQVIKRSRGTAAEQIAALPADLPRPRRSTKDRPEDRAAPKKFRSKKPTPKPTRDDLAAAEANLEEAEVRQRKDRDKLARRERALAREREQMECEQSRELNRLQKERDERREDYDRAIRKWQG